jgi:hypothetical protein
MIRNRQAMLVTNHEPEAGLIFYMLRHVFEKTIILLGTGTPCNRLVKILGLVCLRAYLSVIDAFLVRHV